MGALTYYDKWFQGVTDATRMVYVPPPNAQERQAYSDGWHAYSAPSR